MWQFGGETNYLRSKYINGIGSDVADQNYCYVDYPSIIEKNGLNGYQKQTADKYKVTANALNVRKGPGVEYDIITTLAQNTIVNIVEIENNWGKIIDSGWINLKYCEKL